MHALDNPICNPLVSHRLKSFCLICLLLILCPAAIDAAPVELVLPRHRLQPDELAVIVNDADALSVQIGEYYVKARQLPERNLLHVRFKPGRTSLNRREFAQLKEAVDRVTPAHIQAYAITWIAPYRAECMSITSALTFGFDAAWCSRKRCSPTKKSPLFAYRGTRPYTTLGARPTMSIAATNFADAKKLIDRGIAADSSLPAGTAYLVSTRDKARNVRAVHFPGLVSKMQGWIKTDIVETDALKDRNDVLFYFTGKAKVPYLDTLTFLPGAAADHLTSAGGRLTSHKQMSALRWLEAGATGSYGTVVEPCNLLGKFPHPGIMMDSYGRGRTLIESYWRSVQQPGEGIFIGEPLAAPFDGYTIEEKSDHLLLRTRTLSPGAYQLSYAATPVGPYHLLPDLLEVAHHQQAIELPKPGGSYYRLSGPGRRLPAEPEVVPLFQKLRHR